MKCALWIERTSKFSSRLSASSLEADDLNIWQAHQVEIQFGNGRKVVQASVGNAIRGQNNILQCHEFADLFQPGVVDQRAGEVQLFEMFQSDERLQARALNFLSDKQQFAKLA